MAARKVCAHCGGAIKYGDYVVVRSAFSADQYYHFSKPECYAQAKKERGH